MLLARILTLLLVGTSPQMFAQEAGESPADNLPANIVRLTQFGQRADWSHDGRRILFLERTFGDVFEIEIATGTIRPITHHYFHEGYTRALYLSNGDILLSGAPTFDASDPWPSRNERAELWVLDHRLDRPPTRLGARCSEGPAVSRKALKIAWTVDHGDEPEVLPEGVAQFWMAEIKYSDGTPRLSNTRLILDSRDLEFKTGLETQNFRPPDEQELIFSAYGYEGTEVMGLDLDTGRVVNYSKSPYYEEPEGIFPNGTDTLVEADRHDPRGYQHIDVYKLRLDGSAALERVTFFGNYPGFKASNPVVSDDGRFIAFQMAKLGDPAGVGRGLFIMDLAKGDE